MAAGPALGGPWLPQAARAELALQARVKGSIGLQCGAVCARGSHTCARVDSQLTNNNTDDDNAAVFSVHLVTFCVYSN